MIMWEIIRIITSIFLVIGALIGWIKGVNMTDYVQYNMILITMATVMIIEERQTKKKKNG